MLNMIQDARCMIHNTGYYLEITKDVISKATFLKVFVIESCPQSFLIFRRIPDKSTTRRAGMTYNVALQYELINKLSCILYHIIVKFRRS